MAIGTCFALDDDRPRGGVMRSISDMAGPAVGSTPVAIDPTHTTAG
jgi:hypothetical protein